MNSLDTAKLWISLYDFQNLDYGSKELNSFARNLSNDYFATANLIYTYDTHDSSVVRFKFDYPNYVDYTIYHNAKGYFKVKRGYKVLPGYFKDGESLAKYLKTLFTDAIVAKHLRPTLERYYKDYKEREEIESRKKDEDPHNWDSERKIKEYVKLKTYLDTSLAQYSDETSVYNGWMDANDKLAILESLMTKEELEEARKLL